MSEQTEHVMEEKATGDVDSVDNQQSQSSEGAEQSAQTVETEPETPSTASAEVEASTQNSEAAATDEAAAPDTQTGDAETEPAAKAETDSAAEESAASSEAQSDADEGSRDDAGDADGGDDEYDEDGKKRVVRMLAVGQEVQGEVKRITDFGAFVDIGVGRDGLLHISELSVQRVGKVSDVVKEGQEVTVWIKDLDRARNRISLTMISPDTKTIRDLEKGEIVEGTVTRILPYGAFIDIGVGRDALLHVREMSEGYVKRPEDVVTVGEKLEVRIVAVSRRRNRIDLSLKGLRPEEEEAAAGNEAIEEIAEDPFENVEVLSPMELAFKKAMEADSAEEEKPSKRKRKGSRNRSRSLQDEIIERTLGNRSAE